MYHMYGFLGFLKLLLSYFYTKIFFKNTRLIRLPIDIRNKNNINWDNKLTTGVGCRIEAYPLNKNHQTLIFGDNIQLNDYVHITAMNKVIIGNNVLMASKIYISDCIHGSYAGNSNDSSPLELPINRKLHFKEVVIEDNVWLGESVSVLPGVTIGKGTIVGANSVVTKNLPQYVIAIGTPAKPIKKFNFEKQLWEKI
ncbi:MAG: DapH/DapD/GlmU-related protein [Alphaproteobacteria bacterium]|nr:DapH/DapD/GlmU-related protein [Alphaproteobacteria bacterium]